MFIFDRCRRSSAAVTPVKYECDANNLTGSFARSKILLTGKLTNGALVTPTPGRWIHHMLKSSGLVYVALQPLIEEWFTRQALNTLRPTQDGRHFADDIFTCIFFNENCCILIKFSLKYVRKGPIDNNRALVQIMAWRRSGDKPLSEPMMISLPTHICVSRPQSVKGLIHLPLVPHICVSESVQHWFR